MKNKPTHGGARKGAGRKPEEPTVVMRIPLAIKAKVDKLIEKHKANKDGVDSKKN